MKRDARIGLAVVLVVGLAITLLVARSIHQNGTQAGIDQDPLPQQETASRTDQQVTDAGATLDPASNAQINAVMEFQTQHDYVPGPTTDAAATNPVGAAIDLPPSPAGNALGAVTSTNGTTTPDRSINTVSAGLLPPLGEPPVPFGGNTLSRPAPTLNTLGSYTIAAGDNPWKISAKVFGDGKYAQKIMDANPGLNPARLRIGQKVNIPVIASATPRVALENESGSTTNPLITVSGPAPQEFTTGAGPVPPANGGSTSQVTTSAQTHVVQAGDTLGRIAAKYLGSSGPKAVKKLMDANPGVDARRLKVGQELKIPTP